MSVTDHNRNPLTVMRDDDATHDMIARFLAGEMSPEEATAFRRALEADPALLETVRSDEAMMRAVDGGLVDGSWDAEAAWGRVQGRLSQATAPIESRRTAPIQRRWWRDNGVLLKAAGLGVVLLGTGLLVRRSTTTAPTPVPTVASTVDQTPEYRTAAGERRSITLADGSVIELGVSSRVLVSPTYGRGAREVTLAGEAFFTVEHDERNRFKVLASGTVIEDLGTEFAVRAYASEPVRVSVASGVVEVSGSAVRSDTAILLNARDVVTVSDTGRVVVQRNVDIDRYRAFARGRLVFRDTPLHEVVAELERWYDVEIRLPAGPLAARRYTSEFESMDIDQVLAVIGPSVGVRFLRQGRVVELAPVARGGELPSPPAQVGRGA